MAGILLPKSVSDPAECGRAVSLWRRRWSDLLRDVGRESLWKTPWMNTTFNDGTPFRDGNPIFTAVCPTRHLGVRVIQVEMEDDPTELSAWIDAFAEGDPEEIRELVIHCVLSDATLNTAADLLRKWINPVNEAAVTAELARIHANFSESDDSEEVSAGFQREPS